MDLARYVVDAVIIGKRPYRDVADAHGVSIGWVAKVVARYRRGGYEAIGPRSRAPRRVANRTPLDVEERIIRLRKQLLDDGFDAGAATIHYHLSQQSGPVPSETTIWRILRRRGFVIPQPQKRPKSSWIRFVATLPNELWQSDVTGWRLADRTEVEIITYLDDHSRLILASRVVAVATAQGALRTFRAAAGEYGLPAALLTDNGCVYTAAHRGGRQALESELLALGIVFKHSRPYHPQTCGKIERWHQTLKKFLRKQPRARTIRELQRQLDRFVAYYNDIRPHRALGRRTPRSVYQTRDKARPSAAKITLARDTRVRHDIVDPGGKITLRYKTRLHHIGIGREQNRKRVIILRSGLDIRILTPDGELLRHLTLDPRKDYQPTGRRYSPKGRKLGPRKKKPFTMP
ncbi:MAG: IS481 family transposase [Candidatus Methylomirabilaceae bacterium]